MSGEGKGKEGVLAGSRLLIPTPSSTSRPENEDATSMLRIYYANYQRLKKEQSTLVNQLAIIEREREELRERLEAMRVRLRPRSGSRKRSASDTAGLPGRSAETSCAP